MAPGNLLGAPIAGMLIQATGAESSNSIGPYRAAIFYAAGTGMISTALVIFSRVKLEKKVPEKDVKRKIGIETENGLVFHLHPNIPQEMALGDVSMNPSGTRWKDMMLGFRYQAFSLQGGWPP